MAGDGARSRRQLAKLIQFQGRARVMEALGVDDDTLAGLLDGSLDWPADAREKFNRAWSVLELLGATVEESDEEDEAGAAESGVPEASVPDEVDGAVVEDLPLVSASDEPVAGAEQPVVDAKPTASTGGEMALRRKAEASAAQERAQDLLWTARYLVITRHLRPLGVPRHQQLSAWAVLLRLEIELLQRFAFPLPMLWARRVSWDAEQRRREISLRVQRLEDVRREQGRLRLRRLGGWLLGRDEDRGELLYQRMLDEACQHSPVSSWLLVDANPNWWRYEQLVPRGPEGGDG